MIFTFADTVNLGFMDAVDLMGAVFILIQNPLNVLKDIIGSRAVPVVELNKIFRQAKESLIIVNAHKINNGVIPSHKPSQEKLDNFYFIEQEDPEEVLKIILDLTTERIPRRFSFDPVDDIQILTPMHTHKGTVGAENLNMELQKALNPTEEGGGAAGQEFQDQRQGHADQKQL